MIKIFISSLIILLISSATTVNAQENKETAFTFLSESKYQFDQKNYSLALDFINNAEILLGESNARTLNLKIKILYELEEYKEAKLMIEEFCHYEAGEELKSETNNYLS